MTDVERAWRFLENSDPIASADEVEAAVLRVADEITAKLSKSYPVVLVVMGGAVVFAGQMLPLLRFPIDLDYIHASRYGAATRGAEIDWRVKPPSRMSSSTSTARRASTAPCWSRRSSPWKSRST